MNQNDIEDELGSVEELLSVQKTMDSDIFVITEDQNDFESSDFYLYEGK